MLNGEKMKLRKIATTSTSLIRKTGKLSSFFSFFLGEAEAGLSAGVGLLASGVEPLVQHFEQKNVRDAMYLMSGTYWRTVVQAYRGRGG